MPSAPRRVYWDTGCFLCFLNPLEVERRAICEDILRNARDNGSVLIYTSTLTIAEVIYPKRSSMPTSRQLNSKEVASIASMFRWNWLRKVSVDQLIAFRAVDLSREFGLLPADAIHAATAILQNVDALQKWDRDFDCIGHLVSVESPTRISLQASFDDMLPRIGPHPDDFAIQSP